MKMFGKARTGSSGSLGGKVDECKGTKGRRGIRRKGGGAGCVCVGDRGSLACRQLEEQNMAMRFSGLVCWALDRPESYAKTGVEQWQDGCVFSLAGVGSREWETHKGLTACVTPTSQGTE